MTDTTRKYGPARRRRVPRKRTWLPALATSILAAAGLCGCGATTPQAAHAGAPASSTGQTATTVSRSVPPARTHPRKSNPSAKTKAAVLAAYRASWADFLAAAEQDPVDPADPRLADHMAGAELSFVRISLSTLSISREHDVGSVDTSRARVTELRENEAIVSDCDFDHTTRVADNTGVVINPAAKSRTLEEESLILLGGKWKVTNGSSSGKPCE